MGSEGKRLGEPSDCLASLTPWGGGEKEGRMSSIEIQFSESFGKGDGDFLSQCCCQKSLVSQEESYVCILAHSVFGWEQP